MAVYRQIHVSFWQDDFVLELTPEEKYFYLYLMTNSKTSQCGIYELPKKVMEFETGYNRETVEKLLQKFIDYGKISYECANNELFLRNWMRHNMNSSPKVMHRVERELRGVKTRAFVEELEQVFIQYGYGIDTEPQKEKEEEEEKEHKDQIAHFFEQIWNLYPEKRGKARVSDTQKRTLYQHGFDTIKKCIDRYKATKEDWKKWQHGSTFFNSGYVDYLDENFQEQEQPKPRAHMTRKEKDELDRRLLS